MNDIEAAMTWIEICKLLFDDGCLFYCYYDLAIQALKEKQERDAMRCENCKHRYGDWGCAHEQWDCEGQYHPTKDDDFCSYFEASKREDKSV